ncbi:MAG: YitT family protein [Chloroflexi bacterium]|nr:YitT family protein [Chloroflexota bacterium]
MQSTLLQHREAVATTRDYTLIAVGSLLQAISVIVFLAPADLASGGVSGLAVIVNQLVPGLPIGAIVLVLNLPLFRLGIRTLGGLRFFVRTIVTVAMYSVLMVVLAAAGIKSVTGDIVLNTLFGAIIGGVGMGLVFRAKSTTGGTDVLTQILLRWRGIPLSQGYLITDAAVMLLAGLIFGWEKALYALIALYVTGLVAEATSEGVGVTRTVTVITQAPDLVAAAVMTHMGRGVTRWTATGAYTGQERPILFIVISRAEVAVLKSIIYDADPHAFFVIGQAHEVYGEGFKQFERR